MSSNAPPDNGSQFTTGMPKERAAALLYDTAIWSPIAIVISRILRQSHSGRRRSLTEQLILQMLKATYFTVPTVILGGTPGKLIVGLRVVDKDSGKNARWTQAIIRWSAAALPGIVIAAVMRAQFKRGFENLEEEFGKLGPGIESLAEEFAEDDTGLEGAVGSLFAESQVPHLIRRGLLRPAAVSTALSGVSIASVVMDPKGRATHDRIARTLVIHHRSGRLGRRHGGR